MADDKVLRFGIEADADDAIATVEELEGKVEGLEDADTKLEVTADTDRASAALEDVLEDAEAIDKATPKLKVTVDADAVDDARRKIRSVADDAGTEGGRAGREFGGSFVSDLGSSVNEEAAGVASGFVDAFEQGLLASGLSDSVVSKALGLTAFGAVALVGVAAFWKAYNEGAEEAARKTGEALDNQRLLAAGKTAEAAEKIIEQNRTLFDTAAKIGVSDSDLVKFITGVTDKLPGFNTALKTSADTMDEAGRIARERNISYENALALVAKLTPAVQEQSRRYQEQNGTLREQQLRQFEVSAALGATNDALLEQARTAIPEAKAEMLRYIAVQNGIPPEKITKILTDLDPDDVAQVERELELITRNREVLLTFNARYPAIVAAWLAAGGNARDLLVGINQAGPTTFVQQTTINAGFGSDAFAITQAVQAAQRQANRVNRGARRNG